MRKPLINAGCFVDYAYGEKVVFTRGFYKGRTGKIVGYELLEEAKNGSDVLYTIRLSAFRKTRAFPTDFVRLAKL